MIFCYLPSVLVKNYPEMSVTNKIRTNQNNTDCFLLCVNCYNRMHMSL